LKEGRSGIHGSLQTKILTPELTILQAPLDRIFLTLSTPLQEKEAARAGLEFNHWLSTWYLALNTLTQKLSLLDSTHHANLAIIASLKRLKDRNPRPPSKMGLHKLLHTKGVKNRLPSCFGLHQNFLISASISSFNFLGNFSVDMAYIRVDKATNLIRVARPIQERLLLFHPLIRASTRFLT
jgi:hypothetical protein